MKISITFLFLCFALPLLAQSQAEFRLNPDKPKIGQQINFVYEGDFSKTIDPRFALYYLDEGRIKWIVLKSTFTGKNTIGSFKLPKGITSFCIKPRNTRSKETTEAFVFYVYKNNEIVKGARTSAANFYYGLSAYTGLNQIKTAYQLYETEFTINPELKPKLLASYLSKFAPTYINVKNDLNLIWTDSLKYGNDKVFLSKLLNVIKSSYADTLLVKQYATEFKKKYPEFSDEFISHINTLLPQIGKPTFKPALKLFEDKYQGVYNHEALDKVYEKAALNEICNNRFAEADSLISKVFSPEIKEKIYIEDVKYNLNQGENYNRAANSVQYALKLINLREMPYYMFDKENFAKTLEYAKSRYLNLYAKVLFKQNNTDSALSVLKSVQEISHDEEESEDYIELLLLSGHEEEALKVAERCFLTDESSDKIEDLWKEAYIKSNKTKQSFADYYNNLVSITDKKFEVHQYSKFNVPAIDFTLSDIKGNSFTLKKYLGKTVVLYFFDVKNTDNERDYSNTCFNTMAKDKLYKDVVFVGIDKTRIFGGNQSRLQLITDYMDKHQFGFSVLLDTHHYNERSFISYFDVAESYSSDDLSQFYVIDAKGMVRYKSFPYQGSSKNFKRELAKAIDYAKSGITKK